MSTMITLTPDHPMYVAGKTEAVPACGAAGLRACLPKLSAKDRTFAQSMLAGYDKYGRFTSGQTPWVEKLIARAMGEAPQVVVAPVGTMSGVMGIFSKAKQSGLKHPKLTVAASPAFEVELSVAGATARVPGSLNVTDGKGYRMGIWFGRIVNGVFQAKEGLDDAALTTVTTLLRNLSEDPLGVISQSGHLTGRCSCCGRKLDDPKSVAAGIGPVCQQKWLGA